MLLRVSKKISKLAGQTNAKYGLIQGSDKILVGLVEKDSL